MEHRRSGWPPPPTGEQIGAPPLWRSIQAVEWEATSLAFKRERDSDRDREKAASGECNELKGEGKGIASESWPRCRALSPPDESAFLSLSLSLSLLLPFELGQADTRTTAAAAAAKQTGLDEGWLG